MSQLHGITYKKLSVLSGMTTAAGTLPIGWIASQSAAEVRVSDEIWKWKMEMFAKQSSGCTEDEHTTQKCYLLHSITFPERRFMWLTHNKMDV